MEMPLFTQSSSDDPERVTGARFSLASSRLNRADHMVSHPVSRARILEYPKPTRDQFLIREKLRATGILLGHRLDQDGGTDAFRIPVSSRPVIYDAQSNAQGAFSYGDDVMFYDLGELLALGYKASGGKPITSGLGENIAFVEFTHPDERRLFLVPGVETLIDEVSEGFDPLAHYSDLLTQELGERFDSEAAVYFQMGYNEVGM